MHDAIERGDAVTFRALLMRAGAARRMGELDKYGHTPAEHIALRLKQTLSPDIQEILREMLKDCEAFAKEHAKNT